MSVGGVRDESEIRGHRRTYIGAMPGTIVRALRDAGSNNPVLMIDEIDKMGADFRGDPASAMLEVLDPEQNSTFRDHYLDVPVDLSNVFFICTANQVDTIPPALLDRMETIELSGYTHEEKREIAKRYLVPRQMERNGLGKSKIEITKPALDRIIDGYTREAGVRSLEREIGSICRKVAREFAEGTRRSKRTVRPETVEELLGKPRFQQEVKRRTSEPGVATGLAWTPFGGDVLFVEAIAYPGDGKLQITGQLGDVMKESAAAALSYVKNRTEAAQRRRLARLVQGARPARARSRRGDPEGRPERRDHDGHGDRIACDLPPRALRHRDDRRDHAQRNGAADRRAEGEGARGSARRHQPPDHPAPQRARHRRHPRAAAQEDEVHARRFGRRGARRRASEAPAAFAACQTRVECAAGKRIEETQWQQRKRP